MKIKKIATSFWIGMACLAMIGLVGAIPAAAQGGQTVHTVQAGETLHLIAQQYGVTVDAIVSANQLSDPDQIKVGQRLIIPTAGAAASTTVYTVQPGDTLALIARRYATTVDKLATLNLLTNPNLIYVGQKLYLPAAQAPAPPQTTGQVYVVQPGDTLANIAARYGLTVWNIAQANEIDNPNVVHVGQRLLIPTDKGHSSLPLPFLSVKIIPVVAVQGQTVQVVIETQGEVTLDGAYNDHPLFFVASQVGDVSQYRTLIGIYALASPGPYPLDLKARQGDQVVSVRNMIQVVEGRFGVQYLTFSGEKAQLLAPDIVAQEAKKVWDVTAQATLPQKWQAAFTLPLAGDPVVSAPFGIRRSYGAGRPPTSFHSGVDYGVPENTPVYSPAAGRVVLAEALQVRGNAVIIDHGRGVMSGYWHLAQINVVVGQEVSAGDVLGLVGSTGLSTGAHLHWEMRIMGVQVDPRQWVQENIH